jgi:hypothetical protein
MPQEGGSIGGVGSGVVGVEKRFGIDKHTLITKPKERCIMYNKI